MQTLRCDHCASTDLLRLSPGEYKCNHCQTKQHLAEATAPPSPKEAKPLAPVPVVAGQKARAVAVLIAAVIGLAVVRGAIRKQRQIQARQTILRNLPYRPVETRTYPTTTTLYKGPAYTPPALARAQKPAVFSGDAVVPDKKVGGEFVNAVAIPDRIGNVYFVGLFRNTGEATLERPRVEATLWDGQKKKLAGGFGYAASPDVLPGEEVPVKIQVQRAPPWQEVTFHTAPAPKMYGTASRFDLKVEGAKLEKNRLSGYQIAGFVRNAGAEAVQHVRITGLLYGKNKQIVGMQDGFASQREIEPKDNSPFSISILSTTEPPTSFQIYTSAMPKRTP
ncbi:MAG TPA: hypothetical protein PKE31_18205 [Pseudomonadota bacterium]|nr:hypothetical protein [Pseudomonadota bacterium]